MSENLFISVNIDSTYVILAAQQWGPATMRLILHDKALLDLEAPFAANQNADIVTGGTVPGGIGLEDLILSPSIRDCYQVILSTFNHILGRGSRVEQIYGRRAYY